MTQHKNQNHRFRRYFAACAGLSLLAAGLFFVPRAAAFGGFHGHRGHHGPKSQSDVREHIGERADFILDKLNAGEAQRAQVDSILDKAAPQMFKLHEEGRLLKDEIKTALLAEQIDKNRLDRARTSLDALAGRATELGMDTMVAVAEVLTPVQRKQVAAHLARFGR